MKAGVLWLSGVIFSASALAEVTVCKMNAVQRRVEVAQLQGDAGSGCEVRYYKDTEQPEAGAKVLWAYKVETTQCKEKADGFVQKLGTMGYSCAAETAAP